MLSPVIKLKFDKKLDQDLAWEFYSNPEFGGCDFWKERALPYHADLSKMESIKNPKSFLNKYIIEYYKSHSLELKKLSKKTQERLDQSQEDFFKTVDKIFNHYPWPVKELTGVFSIFDFCPRFLDWGGFQIFIYDNRNMQLFTIFHEMLHFIFYDFVQKKFSDKFKNLSTEEGLFWDLAEVFNAVIQDTDDFIKLHGKIDNLGYPDHKKLIVRGKKIWKENPNIEEWVDKMTKERQHYELKKFDF